MTGINWLFDDQAFHSPNHACPARSLAGLPCPRGVDEISLTLLDTTMTIITIMTIKKHYLNYSGVRPWRHGVATDLARRSLHLSQQDHRLQDLLRSQGKTAHGGRIVFFRQGIRGL